MKKNLLVMMKINKVKYNQKIPIKIPKVHKYLKQMMQIKQLVIVKQYKIVMINFFKIFQVEVLIKSSHFVCN